MNDELLTEEDVMDNEAEVSLEPQSSKSPVQYYYESVARNSLVLSKDEQSELLEKMGKTQCPKKNKEYIDTICRANLKLVFKIAKNYSYNEESLMNYISAGNEGLIKAVHKYKPGKAPFPNYAPLWIRQRILQEIYSNTLLKVPLWRVKAFIKIKLTVQTYLSENNNKTPTDDELTELTGLNLKNVSEIRNDVYLTKLLDRASNDDDFPIYNIMDESTVKLEALQADSVNQDAEQFNVKDIINSVICYLTNEQKFVVQACFGLIDGNAKKLHEVAHVIGRTPERVRQIRVEATDILRDLLTDAGIKPEDYL